MEDLQKNGKKKKQDKDVTDDTMLLKNVVLCCSGWFIAEMKNNDYFTNFCNDTVTYITFSKKMILFSKITCCTTKDLC